MNPPIAKRNLRQKRDRIKATYEGKDQNERRQFRARVQTTGTHEILATSPISGTSAGRLHYRDVEQLTKEITMKKFVFAVCCATLMGLGTAAAQTSGPPAQDNMKQNDTMSNGSSMSGDQMSKGKMAKSKTSKHKTVGMSKSSKMKSDSMSKDNMSK